MTVSPRSFAHNKIKVDAVEKADAWYSYLCSQSYSFAVTLSWNRHTLGSTTSSCYNLCPRDGIYTTHRKGSRTNKIYSSAQVDPVGSVAVIDELYRLGDKKLFGPRFNKLPDEGRTRFVGIAENMDTNYHIHFAWFVPLKAQGRFYSTIEAIWRNMESRSSIRIRPIYSNGWYRYMTDSIRNCTIPDEIPIYISSRIGKSQ